MALAQQRAQQITVDFSHNGYVPGTAEVIAWNISPDPVTTAVSQWQGSPPHWAILTDPRYTHIGCGHADTGDGRHFYACLLAGGPLTVTAPPSLTALPNTAYSEAP